MRLARVFAGLTQTELACRASVSQQYITKLENDRGAPSPEFAEVVAELLGVTVDFLFAQLPDEFREAECHFRKRRTAPAKEKARALARGTMFMKVLDFIEAYVQLPEVDFPLVSASTQNDIELAAEACRRHWGLGVDRPIGHLSRVLENAGAVVTTFESETLKLDAFSRSGRRPVVVLSLAKNSASRSRFDMAHECGHFVLHEDVTTGDHRTEKQADAFASALLLPRAGFLPEFLPTRRVSWEQVFRLKRRWRVSAAAIVRRAFDLGRLSSAAYRSACIEIRKKSWHRGEPEEFEREEGESLADALALIRDGAGISYAAMAEAVGMTLETMEMVTGVKLMRDKPNNILPLFR